MESLYEEKRSLLVLEAAHEIHRTAEPDPYTETEASSLMLEVTDEWSGPLQRLQRDIVMLMTGAASIREVMAFPKTQTASCPLTDAPSEVPGSQLIELNIRLRKVPDKSADS